MENNDNNMDQETTTKKGTKIGAITGVTAVAILGLAFLGVYLFSSIMSDDNKEAATTTCASEIKSDLPSFIKSLVPDADLECDSDGKRILGDEAVGIIKKVKATTKEQIVNELKSFTQSLVNSGKDYSEATLETNLYASYPWLDPNGVSLEIFKTELESNLQAMTTEDALKIVGDKEKLIGYMRQLSTELNNGSDEQPFDRDWNFNTNAGNINAWNPLDFCGNEGCGHGTYCVHGGCMKVEVQIDWFAMEIDEWSIEWWIDF
jgi:hypothetical protein